VTEADVVLHWRKGAKDALEAAELLHREGKYALAMFDVHLAVEKALKAAIMEKTRQPHPRIHDLLALADLLSRAWTDDEHDLFDSLSDFAVAARYDDPEWAAEHATRDATAKWIARASDFLRNFLP
jgi:HEPN domain-containing protein